MRYKHELGVTDKNKLSTFDDLSPAPNSYRVYDSVMGNAQIYAKLRNGPAFSMKSRHEGKMSV